MNGGVAPASPSRPSSRPRRRHRSRARGRYAGWLVVVGTVGLTGLLVWFSILPSLTEKEGERPSPEEIEAWRALREEKLRAFAEAGPEGGRRPADFLLLGEALRLQERIVEVLPEEEEARERLEAIARLREDMPEEKWREDALSLEREGSAIESDDPEGARERYRAALRIYEGIGSLRPGLSREDRLRRSSLQRTLDSLEARPLHEESLALEERARVALEAGNRERARQLWGEAAALQREINQNYPDLRYASPARVSSLRRRSEKVLALDEAEGIAGLLEEAVALLRENRAGEAHAAVVRAVEEQRDLRRNFPNLPWIRREEEERLAVLAADLEGLSAYRELRAREQSLQTALRAREWAKARREIAAITEGLERWRARFPAASLPLGPLEERIGFLSRHAEDLPELTAQVRPALLPLAGGDLSLLRTEVPQSLYEAIMEENPSRSVAADQPVEAVSPREARAFLRRLGWILARPVRLPTLAEVEGLSRSPAGDILPGVVIAGEGRRQPVSVTAGEPGPHGFHHLLGNVAEIVTDGPRFLAYGGSYGNTEEEVREGDWGTLTLDSRSRTLGFRIVVEEEGVPDPLPPGREWILAEAEALLAQRPSSEAR